MNRETKRLITLISILCMGGTMLKSQTLRDGKLFDPGTRMANRAETAPAELDKMSFYIGQWDVEFEVFQQDTVSASGVAKATVTYMNRGHSIMERLHAPDFSGGKGLNTLTFLAWNTANKQWNLGEANSFTESISVYNGDFEDDVLTLKNGVRRRGGIQMTLFKRTIEKESTDAFSISENVSTDYGKTWQKSMIKKYKRRRHDENFMAGSGKFGEVAPGLLEEAREFDFLLGVFSANQELTFPNGQVAKFPSTTTAVRALNGHAIMEFNWYDVDPRLPDAATTIIRIYNRAMRRWESLYMTNRGNGCLFFGGKKEGDRIVLTQFEANAADSPMSFYIFHDAQKDSYKWFANTSFDGGKTFQKTWIIEMQRQESN